MAKLTDKPPDEIGAELNELRAEMDRVIPAKLLDRNLLIATWNIRNLSEVTETWISGPENKHERDLHALRIISEILSRFDVIAIQKVRHGGQALQLLMEGLGEQWGLMITDAARGSLGFNERLAFIFDTRKVLPLGLAGQLVLSEEELRSAGDTFLARQFARPPYIAGFQCLGQHFTLVNLHIVYGPNQSERVPEIRTLARWLDQWAKKSSIWDKNLIVLGQFNLDAEGGPLYQAFTSTGLTIPEDLRRTPSLFTSNSDAPFPLYDQIAWFTNHGAAEFSLTYLRGGNFDFSKTAMRSRRMSKRDLSYSISDHLPLWAEFSVRRSILRADNPSDE